MNAMLQRHCAKHIYIVPDGLRELMTDISREVLRYQPENMYTFIADYLDALMITRENARVAAKLVQSITDISVTTCEFLLNTGIASEDVERIIAIMQQTFKKSIHDPTCLETVMPEEIDEANIISDIINDADIDPLKCEEAAKIIQKAYRNFKIRKEKEHELLSGMIDWRIAARSAIRLYKKTGVTKEEANRAATLIKAAYKGYYTRQIMKKLLYENKMLDRQQDLLAFLEEEQAEADSEEQEEGVRSEKEVTINYSTVIPHVMLGDSEIIDSDLSSSPSTPQVIAKHAMHLILDNAYQMAGLDKFPATETPPKVAPSKGDIEAAEDKVPTEEAASDKPLPPEASETIVEAPPSEPVTEEASELEAQATAEPEIKLEPEPEIKQEPEPEIKQEPEPEIKQETEPEIKQEPVPEIKQEPEPEIKQEPEPEIKQEPESEIKQEEPEPEIKQEIEPEQTEEAPTDT